MKRLLVLLLLAAPALATDSWRYLSAPHVVVIAAGQQFGVSPGPVFVASSDQTCLHGVTYVLAGRNVFQVRYPVVRLDSVLVVDLASDWDRAKECFRHEPVDVMVLSRGARLRANAHNDIAVRQCCWAQDTVVAATRVGSDAAHAAHLVPFVSGDAAPLFGRDSFRVSHVSPPSKESVVRAGVEAATSRRPAFIVCESEGA